MVKKVSMMELSSDRVLKSGVSDGGPWDWCPSVDFFSCSQEFIQVINQT